MATRGFEFAYMLDGSNARPVVRNFAVDGTGAYAVGDLTLTNSSGQLASVTNTAAECTAIIQEARASGSDGDLLKAAIITRNQVWRCSMDASSASAVAGGYTKKQDVANDHCLDADDVTNGSLIVVETSTDDEGNVLGFVVFSDTTFGNA